MNKNDLKNPLIQSGALLLIVFLLISIVSHSEPDGFIDSIVGLAEGILFIIGLIVAIIISIAILIGLFIAAVAIYSVDRAREFSTQLKDTARSLSGKLREVVTVKTRALQSTVAPKAATAPTEMSSEDATRLTAAIDTINGTLKEQQQAVNASAARLEGLANQLDALERAETTESIASLTTAQQQCTAQLSDLSTAVTAVTKRIDELEQRYGAEQQQLKNDLEALREKTSIPEVISGILSYIDRPEDRELVASKAEEAVSRGMTYAQIDEFFQASLSPELFEILSSHPRLTKDFIRSVKKKFA